MKRTYKFWAVVTPKDEIYNEFFAKKRIDAICHRCDWKLNDRNNTIVMDYWKVNFYSKGYRCVKVVLAIEVI